MSRPTFLVPVLEELASRAVASSTNADDLSGAVKSPEWYAARARGVTASEVHKLRVGGARARRELLAAKRAGGVGEDLSGNKYIRWGQVREEFIAEWISRRFGIGANQTLFHGLNPRHLATPDGVGVDFDETLLVHEIKTSKHDLNPHDSDGHFWGTGYFDQIQWQLWVTGAKRCLFVWEQHDDNWDPWPEDGPRPLRSEPGFEWFERDEARIAELVAVADDFLAALDEGAEPETVDPLIEASARSVLLFREQEAQAKKAREAAWKHLQRMVDSRAAFSFKTSAAQVTWTAPVTMEMEEGDDLAACATEEGGRLFQQYADARAAWDEYRAGFTKKVEKVTPGRLTVTAPKKGGS